MRDPYQVLGLNRGASDAEVKSAYRRLAKKYHPDRHVREELGDLKPDFERILSQLADAYEVLSSPPKQSFRNRLLVT